MFTFFVNYMVYWAKCNLVTIKYNIFQSTEYVLQKVNVCMEVFILFTNMQGLLCTKLVTPGLIGVKLQTI